MIVFDAFINGKRLCRAGVGDAGMLYASVAWVQRDTRGRRRGAGFTGEPMLAFNVEGRTEESYRVWQCLNLKVGDQVRLKVLEAQTADPPSRETRVDPAAADKAERRWYLMLKRKYGGRSPKRGKGR
jgi:hypothetical protein